MFKDYSSSGYIYKNIIHSIKHTHEGGITDIDTFIDFSSQRGPRIKYTLEVLKEIRYRDTHGGNIVGVR